MTKQKHYQIGNYHHCMKNPTQKERVTKRLLTMGQISRNECLKNYISRLGAIICDLTKEGWEFETKNVKGDYVYVLKKSPYKVASYTLSDGRVIETIKK